MATSAYPNLAALAADVHVDDQWLQVILVDGRELKVPVGWFARLAQGTPAQRDKWRLIGAGEGIHWEDLDEDISIPRLLGLPCD